MSGVTDRSVGQGGRLPTSPSGGDDPAELGPQQIVLVPYRGDWVTMFNEVASRLRPVIGATLAHVGSTGVPDLAAKPIVDILATVADWGAVDLVVKRLGDCGYEVRERDRGDEPRVFLQHRDGDGRASVHLHFVPVGSAYGRDMIDFRDALRASPERRRSYADLKRQLATAHAHDLEAYTQGKTDFVRRVLEKVRNPYGVDRLLTHQRAELDQAQVLQGAVVTIQFLIAIVAAASVFSNDNVTLLNLAIAGMALVLMWVYVGRLQRRRRAMGDQVRRVVLLRSGLGTEVSKQQMARLIEECEVPLAGRPKMIEEEYFTTQQPPGSRRLAEMLAESAFWTGDLHRTSGRVLALLLGAFVLVPLTVFWSLSSTVETESQVSLARVLVALFVFLLSSEVIGALLGHFETAAAIREIRLRIETASARGYQQGDVLLLLVDYNATVEAAPVTLPFVYRARKARLSRMWSDAVRNGT